MLQRKLVRETGAFWICCVLALAAGPVLGSDARMTPIVRAIQKAQISVVNIHTEKTAHDSTIGFGRMTTRKVNGMGTGIIVDERGYIVTNQHVVAEVDVMRVTLHNGRTFQGEAVSYDPKHDLAIIKISAPEPLPVAPLGTSADLMLGETVLAVGNAFGYEHTVTAGIVSQLHRDVEVNEKQGYKNLIQTDASINPGNSGGPLINVDGEVIGINVAIRANAQRIGFAIPIDDARQRIAKLLDINHLGETWHGLVGKDVKSTSSNMQLLVQGAQPNSPAAMAGLQSGDVIVKAGEVSVSDLADFERALLGRAAGEKVAVEILRGGRKTQLTLEIAALPGSTSAVAANNTPRTVTVARANNVDPQDERLWQTFGLRVAPVPASQVQSANPKLNGGLKILDVRPDSPAAKERIQRGDILWGLDRWQVTNSDEMTWILDNGDIPTINPVKYYLIRQNKSLFGFLELPLEVAQNSKAQ